jgi:hypothetical protein
MPNPWVKRAVGGVKVLERRSDRMESIHRLKDQEIVIPPKMETGTNDEFQQI